jgi:hypothetical protein
MSYRKEEHNTGNDPKIDVSNSTIMSELNWSRPDE